MFAIDVKTWLTNFVESKKRAIKYSIEQSKEKIQKVNSRLYSFQQNYC